MSEHNAEPYDDTDTDHHLLLASRWNDRATDNLRTWGEQRPTLILLALAEEVGEIADELRSEMDDRPDSTDQELVDDVAALGLNVRDHLEDVYTPDVDNDDDPATAPDVPDMTTDAPDAPTHTNISGVLDEVDDAAALMLQLTWALQTSATSTASNTGTWVQTQDGVWHRSTTFDGYEHGLTCGDVVDTPMMDVQMNTRTRPTGDYCPDCLSYWEQNDG